MNATTLSGNQPANETHYDGQAADLGFCEDLISRIEEAEAAFRRGNRPAGVAALAAVDRMLAVAVKRVAHG
jgi:hypothetical protein